ncbi:nuclear transport factor 2 family protein [Microvirga sp. STR05]|uniref:Nuclear transport factor 2 family protein n=1 Tax=Hymenobacter duratus TaxID=2771356 RepID=A0ABR8JHZ1_9BACT|nr:nuclear transport factor 2 family protein [Hymenobacter duratus]MBD2715216.1 nuclear transport factor 2 family protein [Hymenobacter duratus]MBR7950123.1 nuclear transport factor 2 family protein [Microvirga sp. STR05]
MKKILLLLAFLLPVLTFAQSKKDQAATKEVEMLERQRFEAQVKKDYPLLEKLFADDLVYTHSNGKQNNKTEYLQSIRDGKSVYDKIEVEALNVRAYNDGKAAVVNGTITITLPNKPDGTPNLAHLKYVVVQVKDAKKGWQVVLWQSQKQPEAKS